MLILKLINYFFQLLTFGDFTYITMKKQRSPIHAYKRLLANDHDWDYAYLIALEKKKLQRMRECIKEEHHLANNEFVVRDIGICIRLIDIFMENDAVYSTWLDRYIAHG